MLVVMRAAVMAHKGTTSANNGGPYSSGKKPYEVQSIKGKVEAAGTMLSAATSVAVD